MSQIGCSYQIFFVKVVCYVSFLIVKNIFYLAYKCLDGFLYRYLPTNMLYLNFSVNTCQKKSYKIKIT